jgi:hypothetical protein
MQKVPAAILYEISSFYLKGKKMRWEILDRKRRLELSKTYAKCVKLIEKNDGIDIISQEELDNLFKGSIKELDKRWDVPDQFVDKISFEIMTNPVITPRFLCFILSF